MRGATALQQDHPLLTKCNLHDVGSPPLEQFLTHFQQNAILEGIVIRLPMLFFNANLPKGFGSIRFDRRYAMPLERILRVRIHSDHETSGLCDGYDRIDKLLSDKALTVIGN